MRVAIRTDASRQIGAGHVMRCLSLARRLRARGAQVAFVCRRHAGNLIDLVRDREAFAVQVLPPGTACSPGRGEPAHQAWLGADWQTDAQATIEALEAAGPPDWLVVDHYALDYRWETRLRPHTGSIMVVDDLADRRHDCDLLLDQNYYAGMERRYDGLVPADCRMLLGPRHVLLRDEFRREKATLRTRDGRIRRILAFFGGADASGETQKALAALALTALRDVRIDVVIGSQNPARAEIADLAARLPGAMLHEDIDFMARLVAEADLALGAGGASTWERCFLGLPCLTVIAAHNQAETTVAVADLGAIILLGRSEEVDAALIASALGQAAHDPKRLRRVGLAALNLLADNDTDLVADALWPAHSPLESTRG